MRNELLELGFNKINKKEVKLSDDPTLSYYKYYYYLADGRRGQRYYILLDKEKNIFIYSTCPDGSGCPGNINIVSINILIKLKELGYGK